MRPATATLTQKEALKVIAQEPGSQQATVEDLERFAKECERDAVRKERLAQGTRSRTRNATLVHEARQLRGHSNVARLAAKEIERLHVDTVGQAASGKLRRLLLKGVR